MASDRPDDRPLFERLQETTSGEAAIRQLRRRYDLLRGDYERLLDRLGELEHHLADGAAEAMQRESASPPPQAPPTAPTGAGGRDLSHMLTEPLHRVRAEYVAAAATIQQIIDGLGSLAAGAMKGQRPSAGHREPQSSVLPPPPTRPTGTQADDDDGPRPVVTVRAHGVGVPEMLVFQEQLAAMANVERVSIAAIDEEQATLVVELSAAAE